MRIQIGFDIELAVTGPTALIYMLQVHPSRAADVEGGTESITIEPALPTDFYQDGFDNQCARVEIPLGTNSLRIRNEAVVYDTGWPDAVDLGAAQHPVSQLPLGALQFLLPSRYCEVDGELLAFAWSQFGNVPEGWSRVQAVCDYAYQHLYFDYQRARATRTALEAWRERTGVCRDFTHLAITLCRCLNIPARYVTGYLGDIGIAPVPYPMDFSAWFEVYLGDRWYTFDARHNTPRIGRIVIARGRDAADVPITMVFGANSLLRFNVRTDEIVS